jgi:hypothetical protein
MQLKSSRSIAKTVAAMSAVLLGGNIAASSIPGKVESSLLLYSETSRVKAGEGVVAGTFFLKGERVLSAKLTFDGLTGASPNGAAPSRQIQTFTRPSGNGSYTIKPGDTPLDDTFKDTRYAFDLGLTQPLGRLTSLTVGGHFSTEHDYSSIGLNAGISREFFEKNTTIGISGSYAHELVKTVGGTHVPLSSMPVAVDDGGGGEDEDEGGPEGSESKDVVDLLVGITQVIDRQTIFRANYSYGEVSGYLNDPYKLLSLVQPSSGVTPGEPVDYLYEARPDKRSKQSVYGQVRRYLGGHTVDLSYRYFWDDWGIKSNTVELFYRWQLKKEHALVPHVRWYHQTEADFYHAYLVQGDALPGFASADYRLASFNAYTVGLQYIFPLHNGSKINVGGEYYMQRGDASPPDAIGSLRDAKLFPDMNALMFRIGFEHAF